MAFAKRPTDPKYLINHFSLDSCAKGNQGFSRVLIQLFGFSGNGKSSFIDTCKCILDDKPFKTYTHKKEEYGSLTTVRISYPLTSTITLVDNRGLKENIEQERAVVFAQLANLLPLDTEVHWDEGYNGLIEKIVEAEALIKPSDFIYPVFVHSAKKGISSEEVDDIKHLLTTAKDLTGVYPLVILTHKHTHKLDAVKNAFERMNIERIISLENFTPSNNMKTKERSDSVFNFFQEVLEDIVFFLERIRDPVKEKEERKKFVLKYIHRVEINYIHHLKQSENKQEMQKQMRLLKQKELKLEAQKGLEEKLRKENEELQKELERRKKKKKCAQQ